MPFIYPKYFYKYTGNGINLVGNPPPNISEDGIVTNFKPNSYITNNLDYQKLAEPFILQFSFRLTSIIPNNRSIWLLMPGNGYYGLQLLTYTSNNTHITQFISYTGHNSSEFLININIPSNYWVSDEFKQLRLTFTGEKYTLDLIGNNKIDYTNSLVTSQKIYGTEGSINYIILGDGGPLNASRNVNSLLTLDLKNTWLKDQNNKIISSWNL